MSRGGSLKTRFTIVISILFLGFGLFGVCTHYALQRLKVNGPLYQEIVRGKDLVADILPPPVYIIESYLIALQLATTAEAHKQEALLQRFANLRKDFDQRHQFWKTEPLKAETAQVLSVKTREPAERFYRVAEQKFIPALRTGERAATATALAEMQLAYDEHRGAIDSVVTMTTAANSEIEASARTELGRLGTLLLSVYLMSMGMVVANTVMTLRRLMQQLGGDPEIVAGIALAVAEGNLTAARGEPDAPEGSVLSAFFGMREKLRAAMQQINANAEQVAAAAVQLAGSTAQLNDSSAQQSSAYASIASAAEELDSSVRNITALAEQAHERADRVGHTVTNEGTNVDATVATMGAIGAAMQQSSLAVETLINHSKRVSSILSVITDIAEQTNLLALNAAIEAARAGEQGRGFAVVADEVRTLANRTRESTGQIATMIDDIRRSTDGVVEHMQQGNAQVTAGVESSRRTVDTMAHIRKVADSASAAANDISRTLLEQKEATGQIAKDAERVAAMTAASSQTVESMTATATALRRLAGDMQTLVSGFKT